MNNTSVQLTQGFSQKIYYFFFVALFASSFSFQSCDPAKGMVDRDQYSLDQLETIKTDAISLMRRAGKNYSTMAPDVNSFKGKVNDHIEYERDKGEKNTQTVQMWELMMDPGSNLLGGFLNRWESEGKLNGPFMKEAITLISKNFDKIIQLEKKKKKP